MKPPKSTAGQVAAAVGILAGGAALGAGAGYMYMPDGTIGVLPAKTLGIASGALIGGIATAVGALALSEFTDSKWGNVEHLTFLIGGGAASAFFAWGLYEELAMARVLEAPAPSSVPVQLPGSGTSTTTYSATIADAGRALNMSQGDTLALTLPAPSGAQWSLAAPQGLVALQGSPSIANDEQTFILVAGSGSGEVQATPSGGGGLFTLKITVV